jgi:hypothetical protein
MARMIQINGRLFPWTETLAARSDAVEVEVATPRSNVGPSSIKLLSKATDKPGPGWILNAKGRWVQGVYKGHKGRHFEKDRIGVAQ